MTAVFTLQPMERERTLGDRIYSNLKDLLIAGKLMPGDQLSLRKVAEQMGVSIMPVRDAVARLVAEDALHVLPNRAVRVPIMTLTKLKELTTVRVGIEGFATEMAALNRSQEDIEKILALDDAFRTQSRIKNGEASKALALNKDLHFAIYASAGSPVLCSLIETLWLQVGPVINFDLSSADRISTGIAEGHHAKLVSALIAGDAAAARAALASDITDAAKFIAATGKLPD